MHKSVLLHEAIDGLEIKRGDVFVDGTLGGGGHSEEVLKRFAKGKDSGVVMIAVDLDSDAISRASARLKTFKTKIRYIEDSFKNIKSILSSLKIKKVDPVVDFGTAPKERDKKSSAKIHYRVDKILLDLGLSSNQFEDSGRGFTFQKDESLVMTLTKNQKEGDLRAIDILNTWDLENIATILKNYGEEQFAWKIAKAIVARREGRPIVTTFDLVEIIKIATPKWYQHRKIHPATKTFQALRITVNDEIQGLRQGLRDGFDCLNRGGRMAVISFHSLEDREVKHFFKELNMKGLGIIITKKSITPKEKEVKDNPRSRSAKLRIIEKIK